MNVLLMRSKILESVNNEKRSRYAHNDSHVLRLSRHKIGLNILVWERYLIMNVSLHCSTVYDVIQTKRPSGQNADNLNLIRHTISFQKIIVSKIPREGEVAPMLAHGMQG